MGFIHAVEKIAAATPETRQTLLFSATMEGNIAQLARRLLKNPKRIAIASAQARHENIEQRLHHVDGGEQKGNLLTHMLGDASVEKAIVFTATKRGADRLAKKLHAQGHPAGALHGNMNQNQRNRAIQSLRTGKVRLLVATDVAARGLDVNGITHVFNYDLPKNPEDYVHRIGRTGRASAKGIAISFAAPEDRRQLRDIERYTKQPIQAHVVEGFEPKVQPRGDQGRERPRHEGRRDGGQGSFPDRGGKAFRRRAVDEQLFLVVLLRQIAVIHGRIEKDVAVVDLDLTQGMLAQMLGASREAVNKQLRALAKEGRVVMDGHQIQVFKQARL